MTTIVANLDMMVSDSKCSVEHKGIDYPTIKIVKAGGQIFGAAGDGGDCTRFLKWASGGFKLGQEPKWSTTTTTGTEDAVIGLVLNDKGIHIWSYGDPEPEKIESEFYAIGSGGKAARVAMLLGQTPEEAVNLAIAVDPFSGGPLQIIHLENDPVKEKC